MSVISYQLKVLTLQDFNNVLDIPTAQNIIRAWRFKSVYEKKCFNCNHYFDFSKNNFYVCCKALHFNPSVNGYVVKSLAVFTPNINFLPSYLKSRLHGDFHQDFLVLPDPIYWQLESTLIYDSVFSFLTKKLNHLKIQKMYLKIQNAPLYHCSLSYRSQGKESLFRKIAISKRCEQTHRAMIIPCPSLKPNQTILPKNMVSQLHKWVIINRMPTLSPENFVALYVIDIWEKYCIGLPCEILKQIQGDFDGDEVNIFELFSPESQIECEFILNSEKNMYSFSNHMKLFPSQDALVAYYLDPIPKYIKTAHTLKNNNYNLFDFLRLVYEMEGSQSCFQWFDTMRQHYLTLLEDKISFSLCYEEFQNMKQIAKDCSTPENFIEKLEKNNHEMMCLEVQIRSGTRGTYYHLYQLIKSVGLQKIGDKLEMINSSFLDGLTAEEYCIHSRSGHDALIESMIGIWKPGYNYFKLVNSVQNITIDYNGHIVDENCLLNEDALENFHYKDIMSTETFNYIFDIYNENECQSMNKD